MQRNKVLKAMGFAAVFAAILLAGMMSSSRLVRAHDDEGGDQGEEARIDRGLAIAPVHLNLENKDRDLLGLGSYWVNAVADCNGCHSAGPATEYIIPQGNPYFLSPPFSGKQQINPATYLGGGRDFGPFPGPPFPSIPHLYSRNLTPDHTGLPGGRTFEEFRDIMRHGTDFDHLHPNCAGGPGNPPNRNLVFTGCTTSVCVESTIRDAMFRDYRCVLLADCAGEPIGSELPRSNHEASVLTIQTVLGWVSDSERFESALQGRPVAAAVH